MVIYIISQITTSGKQGLFAILVDIKLFHQHRIPDSVKILLFQFLRKCKIRYNRIYYKGIPPFKAGECLYFPEFCIKGLLISENPPYLYKGNWYVDDRKFDTWQDFGIEYCVDLAVLNALQLELKITGDL